MCKVSRWSAYKRLMVSADCTQVGCCCCCFWSMWAGAVCLNHPRFRPIGCLVIMMAASEAGAALAAVQLGCKRTSCFAVQPWDVGRPSPPRFLHRANFSLWPAITPLTSHYTPHESCPLSIYCTVQQTRTQFMLTPAVNRIMHMHTLQQV